MSHNAGATHAPSPTASEGGGAKKVISLVLIGLGLFLLLSHMKNKWEERRAAAKAEEARAAEVARTAPPPAALVVARRGPERTLYRFADYVDGCARAELRSDASFYPKGGKVRIHPPPPGKPWDDEPGVQSSADGSSQTAGWYLICKVDPGAWGVEIWN